MKIGQQPIKAMNPAEYGEESGTKPITMTSKLKAEGYTKDEVKEISKRDDKKVMFELLECRCEYLKSLGMEKPLCMKCFYEKGRNDSKKFLREKYHGEDIKHKSTE